MAKELEVRSREGKAKNDTERASRGTYRSDTASMSSFVGVTIIAFWGVRLVMVRERERA